MHWTLIKIIKILMLVASVLTFLYLIASAIVGNIQEVGYAMLCGLLIFINYKVIQIFEYRIIEQEFLGDLKDLQKQLELAKRQKKIDSLYGNTSKSSKKDSQADK